MSVNSYQDLIVWQKSRELVVKTYRLCNKLPQEEIYGLSSQMKRAAISIPSNIAEGYRRNGVKEYVQFLGIAQGSAAELETQLILANDLFKVDVGEALALVVEVQKMLAVLINKLRS